MIVGVSGRKRSGKDSIGAALVAQLGFTRVAFADGVKDLAAKALNWDPQITRMEIFKGEPILTTLDGPPTMNAPQRVCTGRELLQRIGNGAREVIGDDVWIKLALAKCAGPLLCLLCGKLKYDHPVRDLWHCVRGDPSGAKGRYTPSTRFVITDVRYPNELAAIHAAGGLVIRTNRGDRVDVHDYIDDSVGTCAQKVLNDIGHHRARCNQVREAHPSHDSRDWHSSEVSLPDESNASVKYDFVTTGDLDENVTAALAFIKGALGKLGKDKLDAL